jgi:hypothetical protein
VIEVRQGRALAVATPIERVTLELQRFRCAIAAQLKWTEPDDFRRRGTDSPSIPQLAAAKRSFQFMTRQDRQIGEHLKPACRANGKGQNDSRRIGGSDSDLPAGNEQRIADRADASRIVHSLEGEHDI